MDTSVVNPVRELIGLYMLSQLSMADQIMMMCLGVGYSIPELDNV
jgi:hypothetical protein